MQLKAIANSSHKKEVFNLKAKSFPNPSAFDAAIGDNLSSGKSGAGAAGAAAAAAAAASSKAVKAGRAALGRGSAAVLPDKVGAFYTFGRKKAGASLLAAAKPKHFVAPSIIKKFPKPSPFLSASEPQTRSQVAMKTKKARPEIPDIVPSASHAPSGNLKSLQRFIYLMKEEHTAIQLALSSSQTSKGWGNRNIAPPALQAAWDAHDRDLPKCQHKKCNNRALYGLWKGNNFVSISCERHRTRAGLQRSRPHCSTACCSNVAVMGSFVKNQFHPSKCFHHATPGMVDARGSQDVSFGNPVTAPASVWQNFQAHPHNQQPRGADDDVLHFEAWHEASDEATRDDSLFFDGADDLQNSILWASIKKSGFAFLDVLCHDDASSQSKDPEVVSVRQQCELVSGTDVGRALTSLGITVAGQLRELQIDAARESVLQCHYLSHQGHAAAYFQGEFALVRGRLADALDHFKSALAAPLPQRLFVCSHIGIAAALRELGQETESTNQLRSILKIFPHDCELLLACAQHVLILGRSKDEAEALLQYDTIRALPPQHFCNNLTRHAISVQPRSISVLLAMSRFQLAYRQSHVASKSFADKALQIDPSQHEALLQCAIINAASPNSRAADTRLLLRKAAAAQVHIRSYFVLLETTFRFFFHGCIGLLFLFPFCGILI